MKTRNTQLSRSSCYIFTFLCLSLIHPVQVKQIVKAQEISTHQTLIRGKTLRFPRSFLRKCGSSNTESLQNARIFIIVVDGCIFIIHEVSRAILLSETVFKLWQLNSSCFKSYCFLKDKVLNRSSHVQVIIITVKSQSVWDVQSHSWHVKVLDFAPFKICTWKNA